MTLKFFGHLKSEKGSPWEQTQSYQVTCEKAVAHFQPLKFTFLLYLVNLSLFNLTDDTNIATLLKIIVLTLRTISNHKKYMQYESEDLHNLY